jgi:hypothetical protein
MSSESQPISAERFAEAIQDLPAENLYSKALELENSIAHLERSNKALQEYIDSIKADMSLPEETRMEGDQDCSDAVQENQIVINRQRDRIDLLKREVERRGGRWHEADPLPGSNLTGRNASDVLTRENPSAGGSTISDEELRRRIMDRLGDADNDDDSGMHL